MKKIALLLCCLLLLQLFAGCSGKEEEIQQPVNFYYLNKEITYNTPEGVICSEIREGAQFNDFEDLLRVYLEGPTSSHLQSLLPDGTSLLSCTIENETAQILLSSQFSELSGIKLASVCSGILLTARDFSNVQTIYVRAEGAQLDDKDEFILSVGDLVLLDTETSDGPKE